ncbi:MAG: hypothetical protein P8Y95_06220 [Gammaproteobacteria bacterium]
MAPETAQNAAASSPFFEQFTAYPMEMTRPDGSAKYAFVTFLMMNDSYLASALMLAYGLRQQQSGADTVCMVTKDVSDEARRALGVLYDHVIDVDEFFVHHKSRRGRHDRPLWFTRLHCLRLGADGDLGFGYEKVCILDADVYPLRHFDNLFTLRGPAGILNEDKRHCLESDENGKFIYPDSIRTHGKWNWHARYEPLCKHGERIPRDITDRVATDVANLGLNGSLYVFDTSLDEFHDIERDVDRPEIKRYVGELFKWPDMQYLTMRYSGEWTNIDIKFSSFNGYPRLDLLCGCHYSGFKPWHFKKKSIGLYKGYEDFSFWYAQYFAMIQRDYPALKDFRTLENVARRIHRLLGDEPPPGAFAS